MKIDLRTLILAEVIEDNLIPFINEWINVVLQESDSVVIDIKKTYKYYGDSGFKNYISEYVVNNKIDAIILFSGQDTLDFEPVFLEELRRKVFVVMHTGDDEEHFESLSMYYAQACDLILTSDFIAVYKYKQLGLKAEFFYGGYDLGKYKKLNVAKKYEVSFVGSIYKRGRIENIEFLINNGINVEQFGGGTERGIVSYKELIDVFNETKINLNFTSINNNSPLERRPSIYRRIKQIRSRPVEVPLCGSFILTEYAPGLESLFDIGKEIETFSTKEEMLDKINYYLKHEDERETIARNGHNKAIQNHEMKSSIKDLLRHIKILNDEKIYTRSVIFIDPVFLKNYGSFRINYLIHFLASRKWKFAFEEIRILLKHRKVNWGLVRYHLSRVIAARLSEYPRTRKLLKRIRKLLNRGSIVKP